MIHETLINKLNKNTDCNYGKSVLPWEANGAFILLLQVAAIMESVSS